MEGCSDITELHHISGTIHGGVAGGWVEIPRRGLTIGALDGLHVELLVLLKAADVSLLLQVFGAVEDVLLRDLVGNHLRDVAVLLPRQQKRYAVVQ